LLLVLNVPDLIVLHRLVHLEVIVLEFTGVFGLHVGELAHDLLRRRHCGGGGNDHRSEGFGGVGATGSGSSATRGWWKRSSTRWKHGHGTRREATSSTWHGMHRRHSKALARWWRHHTRWEHHRSSTRRHHLRWVRHVAAWWLCSTTWYWRRHHVRVTHWLHWRRSTITRIL
jgi:hypothetical protein